MPKVLWILRSGIKQMLIYGPGLVIKDACPLLYAGQLLRYPVVLNQVRCEERTKWIQKRKLTKETYAQVSSSYRSV